METTPAPSAPDTDFDVVIIGGGSAGLSAALALGRARRSVLVVDGGHPRNAPAAHMHGVLGHDGRPPGDFLHLGRADVAKYGVTIIDGNAIDARRVDQHAFAITLDDGAVRTSRRIVVASGTTDHLPDIVNLRDRWGRDVIHCPYCHGFERQDTTTAVISTGPMGVHGAMLFRQWSDDVTLFVHTGAEPTGEEHGRLHARGTRVVEGIVAEIVVEDDRITGIRMASGEVHPAETVFIGGTLVPHSPILDALGVATVPGPMGAEVSVGYAADPRGQTDVAGVFAAGNVVDSFATVPAAIAAGYMAGAMCNADLVEEDTDLAVAAFAAPVMDRAFWDDRYASVEQSWSGDPNPHLLTDTAGVTPGLALDVGAGEGADAIWLAEQGWQVDALDISAVALDRGRIEADARGPEIAARISWSAVDVLADGLPTERYDLVSAHFLHFGLDDRRRFLDACIGAVAPGGTLLVVAHHPSDLHGDAGRWNIPGFFYTPAEVVEQLDDTWTVVAAEARPRRATTPSGDEVDIADAVLVARRAGQIADPDA